MSRDLNVPLVDCNICLDLLKLLKGKGWVQVSVVDGQMRAKDVTTTPFHIESHLKREILAETADKGTFRKRKSVKVTDRGLQALARTEKEKVKS